MGNMTTKQPPKTVKTKRQVKIKSNNKSLAQLFCRAVPVFAVTDDAFSWLHKLPIRTTRPDPRCITRIWLTKCQICVRNKIQSDENKLRFAQNNRLLQRNHLQLSHYQPVVLTSGGAVVVFAATFLPGHTHSILQHHVTRTTAGQSAPRGVQALCVTMEIGTRARTGLPARPFFLTSTTVCKSTKGRSLRTVRRHQVLRV